MLLELANGLAKEVRFGGLDPANATIALEYLLRLPIELVPSERLVSGALSLALELGVSAYDGAYIALASTRHALLVTADRRLAAVYEPAELIA